MSMSREEIIERFQVVRSRMKIIVGAGLLLALCAPFIAKFIFAMMGVNLSGAVGFALGLSILLVVVVASLVNWRCPACNKYLSSPRPPQRKWHACPRCGVPLR